MRPFVLHLLRLAMLAGSALLCETGFAQDAGIDDFNAHLATATRSMDNAAMMRLWADDGISLLPSTPPLIGKPAIAKMLDDITTQFPKATMTLFDLKCFNVKVKGDWASEWCTEHQIVDFGNGKAPFDGWGKMLFVLHRDKEGHWLIEREMWNQAIAGQ